MTVPTAHTIPYRHLIGDHLLVPCSACGGELQRVWGAQPVGPVRLGSAVPREYHIVCSACAHDFGPDTTEMLVEGGKG